jgi:enoyl-CoA hydratase/carnithine racemase
LVQAIGLSKAKDILFTGRLLEGEEALAIGLIDRLILPENIDDVAADYAHLIVRASRYSIRAQKAIFDLLRGGADDAPESRALFGASFEGADFKEGLEAFMQKRPAKFPVR